MNAEATSRASDTNRVRVPAGIKTLNKRIIRGPGTGTAARLIILGNAGHPNLQPDSDEDRLSRLPCHHAGGSACSGSDASILWSEIRQRGQRDAPFWMGGGGGGGSGAAEDRAAGGGGGARDRVHRSEERRVGTGWRTSGTP